MQNRERYDRRRNVRVIGNFSVEIGNRRARIGANRSVNASAGIDSVGSSASSSTTTQYLNAFGARVVSISAKPSEAGHVSRGTSEKMVVRIDGHDAMVSTVDRNFFLHPSDYADRLLIEDSARDAVVFLRKNYANNESRR